MLYMPGSNERALEKAKTLPADGIILDLEDSVAPERKRAARDAIAAALRSGGYGAREIVVRVNGLDTPWGAADVAALAPLAPHAVLVPKISTAADVLAAGRALADAGAPDATRLWIMMETPRAILEAQSIAATALDPASRLSAFVLGLNDIAKDTRVRIEPGRATVLPWIMQCVLAARAYGVDVLDSVYNDFTNAEGFAAECAQGASCGMDGKTLIHPSQIAAANAAYAPAQAEVDWSRRVVEAFAEPGNADKGAINLDGKMVERLHVFGAQRVLALAEAIAARAGSLA
jgi:citrate lyase subunit beta/citryl-CoA lyase